MNKPHNNLARLAATARKAARAKNWALVKSCSSEILKHDQHNADGWFLTGLLEKAGGRHPQAAAAFSKSLHFDAKRYDAGIELANLCLQFFKNREAVMLIKQYESFLDNSPYYLDIAANAYTRLGLHDRAWPLYKRANDLQPDIDRFQSSLAACSVLVGKIKSARALYTALLKRHPGHQRNHYALAQLERAKDSVHVDQMKRLLDTTNLPDEKNIFLYYALGKELEDLERWDEAYEYYEKGGNAAASQARAAGYDVSRDIELIDKIIEVCKLDWLTHHADISMSERMTRTPIFIVGLPRTGTTLTERILASHSKVESADETFFMQIIIKRISGVNTQDTMNPRIIESAAQKNIDQVAGKYLDAIEYRLGDRDFFIDKFPENYFYLGFIAKAFPDAKIIHLRRNPMDACFAMFKQSYFRQAYTLEDLGNYYVAYDRLSRHWQDVLGDRLIEVEYEKLVSDLETETRSLLEKLGLEFHPGCLEFHKNPTPSATASTVQVREKAHTRSVDKWKNWERQLQPLRDHLELSGITV